MFLAAKPGKLENERFDNLTAAQSVEPSLKEPVGLCKYLNHRR